MTPDSPPEANGEEVVLHSIAGGSLSLLSNDTDPDEDQLVITHHTDPAIGTGTVDCGAGDCTYFPPVGFAGPFPLTASFEYTVGDGRGLFDTASVQVTLLPNLPPVAQDDRGTARFGDPTSIGVTGNDTDPEGDPLSVELCTPANHTPADDIPCKVAAEGVATCALTGCSYKAPPGFFGEDSFTYRVSDGNGGTDVATIYVAVLQNRAPVAIADEAHVSTRNHVEIDPVTNDSDPDDDAIHLDDWTPAHLGTVVCETTCRYTPDDGATGTDTFTYTISDGRGGSAVATVTIEIAENGPPTAVDDSAATIDTRTAALSVLGNDTDPDHDQLRVVSHTEGTIGTVACTFSACSYTLDAGYPGPFPATDSFTYVMTDGKTGSDEATVEITIETNRPPVANPDSAHAHGLALQPVSLLGNDTDPDGDPLTLVGVSSDRIGCSEFGCVYTPPPAPGGVYPFTDSIDYQISDGHGHLAAGTIAVEVVANGNPTAVDDNVTARTGREVLFSVLGNDGDPDGDPLTIVGSTPTGHGTVACPSSVYGKAPSCTYVSDAGYLGDDAFTYTIADGLGGATATATVRISVVPLNTPVEAFDDAITIYRAVTTDVNVTANDRDAENDPLRIVSWTPAPGAATAKGGFVSCPTQPGSGVCRYTPPVGNTTFPLVDTFTYRVTDGFAAVDEATVTITLDNRAPIATPDHAVAHGAVPESINVLANDSDPDDDPIVSLAVDLTGATGTATCSVLTGHCRYSPAAGILGTDVFHYTITDSRGASATTTVTVDVVANRPPDAVDDIVNVGASLAPASINVRSNDSDLDGDFISVVPSGPSATDHGTVECDAEGCVYTRAPGPASSDTFDYVLDDGHGGQDAATVHIGLDEVALVIGLRSAPNPSSLGQPVTFTATIQAPGLGLPTGHVTFLDDGISIGSAAVTNGTARLTIDTLGVGSHPIVASYVGSGGLAGQSGMSPVVVHVVGIAATTTTLTSDLDPSAVGATVTFTASVSESGPGSPTGTVTFLDGATELGTATLTGGAATLPVSTLAAGVHDIAARYDGDASFAGSTSVVLHQHVGTPTAIDDLAAVSEDALPTRVDVLANDTDPDAGDTLAIVDMSDPAHGSSSIDDGGTPGDPTDDAVLYQPDADFNGPDSLTYTISDGTQQASATVSIIVSPVNDAPLAADLVVAPAIPAGAVRTITLTGTDIDSASLGFAIVDAPTAGSLGQVGTPVCTPAGHGVTCTATVDYTAGSADDTFSFRVNDGDLDSNLGSVAITVITAPNPPPVVNAGPAVSGTEGSAVSLDGTVTNSPASDSLTQTWSYTLGAGTDAGMSCQFADDHAIDTTIRCTDDGTVTLTLTADDGVNPPVAASATLTLANADPTVSITSPADGANVEVGASVDLSAALGDPGINDSQTCSIAWGDAVTSSRNHRSRQLCRQPHLRHGRPTNDHRDGDRRRCRPEERIGGDHGHRRAQPATGRQRRSRRLGHRGIGRQPRRHGHQQPGQRQPDPDLVVHARRGDRRRDELPVRRRPRHRHDHPCTDDGTVTLTLTADDGVNPPVAASATLTLANADPTVSSPARCRPPGPVSTSVCRLRSPTPASTTRRRVRSRGVTR